MMKTQFNLLFFSFLYLVFAGTSVAQPIMMGHTPEDLYSEGMELYRKGQYGNAQRVLDQVAEDETTSDREKKANAAYFATLSAMKLYNGDADLRVEKFARDYPLSPLLNQLYFRYANYRFSLKRYRDAAEYYGKTDKYRLKGENLNEYYFKKGYSHLMAEEEDQAKALFFELKDRDSKYSTSAQYYHAHLLYADSNYTEALSGFLPLQDDESFGPLIPYYLAHIYYRLNDYDKLLEVGEDLIENATPSRAPEIAKLMGDAFYTKEDYRNAVKYLELYKDKGGKMRQKDHFQLGYAYYKTGRTYDAINSFNKITNSGGNNALQQNAWYHLGDLYLKQGEKQQAMTAFKAASEIDASPTVREDAYFNYAKLSYEISNPFEDAITTLNDFLDEFPDSPHKKEVNRYLANLYVTTKDYERAMEAIERTGMQSPAMKEAYQKVAFYRASELFNSLKYQAAIDKYKESLQYDINTTIAALSHYWIGEAEYRLGNYNAALEQFDEFRKSPGAFAMDEYQHSLYSSAYAYYKKFDFEQAAKLFRNYTRDADRKDPRISDAYLRLADSYLITGGYIPAADFYKSSIVTGTKEADYALYQRAIALGLDGKIPQKLDELNNLLEKYPKSVYAEDAQFELAATYLKQEKYNRAIAEFQEYINKYPSSSSVPRAQLQMGLAYANQDENDQALKTYKGIVAEYPGSEASLEAVGLARLVYARQNRISDYLDWVETIEFVNFDKATLDSTAFSTAFDQYSAGNCQSAITALQDYLKRFPQGLFQLKANYYLAECAEKLNREELATSSYKNILATQRNEYTPAALRYMASQAYGEKDYVQARDYYKEWSQIARGKEEILRAQAGLMRTSYKLGDYDQAELYAGLVLNSPSLETSLKQEAAQVQAFSLVEQQQWEEATEKLHNLIANSAGELKAEAFYNLAVVQYEQGKWEESNQTVYKLIEEVPDYKEWKLKALILSAKNFWRQEDIFQANYTVDYVINEAYSSEITTEAQELKERIAQEEERKAKQKESQAQTDSLMLDNDGMMIIDKKETTDTTENR